MKKMQIVYLIISSFLLLSFLGVSQQQDSAKVLSIKEISFNKLDYTIGYHGVFLWNPGLNIGAELVIYDKKYSKTKKSGKIKTKTSQKVLSGNIGGYFESREVGSIFTYYGMAFRRTNQKGFQLTFQVNPIGVSKSILPETYEVRNGEVKKIFFPGKFYYSPSISFGIGKYKPNKRLKASYFNLHLSTLIKHNISFLPVVAIQYGYRFNIK